jgi:hypothetical protein
MELELELWLRTGESRRRMRRVEAGVPGVHVLLKGMSMIRGVGESFPKSR